MSTLADSPALSIPVPLDAAPALRTSPDRLLSLDLVRLFAAVSVIWFHSIESITLHFSGILGRFSVAFYTLIAILFMIQSLAKKPHAYSSLLHFARAKFLRLYVPFLGWSLISFLLLALAHLADETLSAPGFSLDTLVTGTVEPLWFIPFIFLALLAVFPLARWMLPSRPRQILVASAAASLALFLDFGPLPLDAPLLHIPLLGKLVELSWNRWSTVLWALVLAVLWLQFIKNNPILRKRLALVALAVLIPLTIYQWSEGVSPTLKIYCGLALALIALTPLQSIHTRSPQLAARLAKLGHGCFGLYFAHMAYIWLTRAICNRYDFPICWQRDILIFLTSLALALLTTESLRRQKSLQWLVA